MSRRRRQPQPPAERPTPALSGESAGGPTGPARRFTGPFRLAVVAALLVAGWLVWPQITLPFSQVAPIVTTLRADSVFVEDGAAVPADTAQRVRETLGRRPAAMVVLAADSAFTDRPLDICTAVVDHIDDVELMVTQVGRGFVAQCQGSDLPVLTDELRFDAGIAYTLDRATRMFDEDIPGQAEQLALVMDSSVRGGRLSDTERTFSAPVTAWLAAGGIVVGVVGGAVLLFWGVRRGSRALVTRQRRRAEFAAGYRDVEAVVSETAMVLLDIDPRDARRTAAAAALAQDYRTVLTDLEAATDAPALDSVRGRAGEILTALRKVNR